MKDTRHIAAISEYCIQNSLAKPLTSDITMQRRIFPPYLAMTG
jgi:hypothetical protein